MILAALTKKDHSARTGKGWHKLVGMFSFSSRCFRILPLFAQNVSSRKESVSETQSEEKIEVLYPFQEGTCTRFCFHVICFTLNFIQCFLNPFKHLNFKVKLDRLLFDGQFIAKILHRFGESRRNTVRSWTRNKKSRKKST